MGNGLCMQHKVQQDGLPLAEGAQVPKKGGGATCAQRPHGEKKRREAFCLKARMLFFKEPSSHTVQASA